MGMFNAIQNLLDTHLLTVVTEGNLQRENERVKSTGADFYRSTLIPSQTEIITLGPDGMDRINGVYQIDVFTKIGSGTEAANDKADSIMDAYTKGSYHDHVTEGIRVIIENKWRLPAQEFQHYYQVPVFVQWSVYKV